MSSTALRCASNTRNVYLRGPLAFSSRAISPSATYSRDAAFSRVATTAPERLERASSSSAVPISSASINPKNTKQRHDQEQNPITNPLENLIRSNKELKHFHGKLIKIFRAQRRFDASIRRGPYGVVEDPNSQFEKNLSRVKVKEGTVRVGQIKIPHIWLRDNCQCASCVHQDTRQRLVDTFSIPENISIKSAAETRDGLTIEWSDGHKSDYSKVFLLETVSREDQRSYIRQGTVKINLWDASIAENLPKVLFQEYQDATSESNKDSMLGKTLSNLRRFGFCYVENVPISPEATEALLRRVAFIRETHYGGFYDFTADLASKDTAYTNIALEAHTDTTYFSDPAGLQAFHLLSHTDGSGGESLLVDGFKAAKQLHQQDRRSYEILATTNVHAHASGNEGISIMPYRGFPVLEHDQATGNLLRVRWNTSDRARVELPVSDVTLWYDAARKFDRILKEKKNELWEQLKPGTVVIFDNWRVLHGRSAFTGKRRICGGYINRDDWISKFKVMHFGKEKVLASLASG